jgi:hypothetical protein
MPINWRRIQKTNNTLIDQAQKEFADIENSFDVAHDQNEWKYSSVL